MKLKKKQRQHFKNRERKQVPSKLRQIHPCYTEVKNFVWEKENKATALLNLQSLEAARDQRIFLRDIQRLDLIYRENIPACIFPLATAKPTVKPFFHLATVVSLKG